MSDQNKTSNSILQGGEINFIDIASLAIAVSLFVAQGDDKILEAIGNIADSIKEGFASNEETTDEQPHN